MTKWLLSGHNPQETTGIPYPITTSYTVEFVGRRQMEYLVGALAGGLDQLDRTIPFMLTVHGRLYIAADYLARNLALVLPYDPESMGVPKGLLEAKRSPNLATRLALPARFWRIYRQTMNAYKETIPNYRQIMQKRYWRLRECDPDRLTPQDLAELETVFGQETLDDMTTLLNALLVTFLFNVGITGIMTARAPELLNLLIGKGTSTALLGQRMWELRELAKKSGDRVIAMLQDKETCPDAYRKIPEAKDLVQAIDRFVETYGHRAFQYASEFEATRLADQPDLVLLTIGGLLGMEESPIMRAEAAIQKGNEALQKMPGPKRAFWRRLLTLGSRFLERREENRDTLELQQATMGLAARLLSHHYFPGQPDDTLWLYTFDEFVEFGRSEGKQRVALDVLQQRRNKLEFNRQRLAPPELIWYDPETYYWTPAQEEMEQAPGIQVMRLQGIGVSAGSGIAEGIAVVTNNAQEAVERLLGYAGSVVLVTHVTDPVWSSIFPRLAAIVTEMGGSISHASIVARENGIPAVVGVAQATHHIIDGQRVRVDGAAGTVEVIEPALSASPI